MLIAAWLSINPAVANQIRFTGQTTANELLIKDTLQNIARFGDALDCTNLNTVEAKVMPTDYVPSEPSMVRSEPGTIYEHWTADFCGKNEEFLISFWPSEAGGTMFGIGYPFPVED